MATRYLRAVFVLLFSAAMTPPPAAIAVFLLSSPAGGGDDLRKRTHAGEPARLFTSAGDVWTRPGPQLFGDEQPPLWPNGVPGSRSEARNQSIEDWIDQCLKAKKAPDRISAARTLERLAQNHRDQVTELLPAEQAELRRGLAAARLKSRDTQVKNHAAAGLKSLGPEKRKRKR